MRNLTILATSGALALALLSGCGSSGYGGSGGSAKTATNASSNGGGSGVTVKTASIPSAGGTVLVDSQGMTLYSLSAEHNGRFICTGSCESVWHPLSASGGTPAGVQALAIVKRPDGTQQVTYKGMPLYTFANDAPGEAKGQGVKDVGTWSAVVVSGSSAGSAPAPTTSATTTPSSSGGYHY